jgi:hypothetical protein
MSNELKMRALFEALADSVEGLSDEEVLAECREDGRSPEDVAKRTRAVLQNAVKGFRQRALIAAKEKHLESAAKIAAKKFRLPDSLTERRALLDAVIAQHQQAGKLLTAQHRDFSEMTDEDVESWLQQFGHLGLLDPKAEPGE